MSWLSTMFGGGAGATRISGATARELVAAGAQLVDVRTPAEFGGGHIPGAKNIPVDQIAARHSELDPKKPVVVYCRSGGRSASAGSTLVGAGFTQVSDLGPMSAW